MKKLLKLLLLSLVVLSICACMSGCRMIEDLRKSQAFYGEDSTLTLDGNTYKLLPNDNSFAPKTDDESGALYITKADVPVLLSVILGDRAYVTENRDIIRVDFLEEPFSVHYCREDKYATIVKKIEQGFTPAGYMYTAEKMVDGNTFDSETVEYYLTDLEVSALKTAKDTAVLSDHLAETVMGGFDCMAELYLYSDDGYFAEYGYSLYRLGDAFYLSEEGEDEDEQHLWSLDPANNEVFAAILKTQAECDATWTEFYGE